VELFGSERAGQRASAPSVKEVLQPTDIAFLNRSVIGLGIEARDPLDSESAFCC